LRIENLLSLFVLFFISSKVVDLTVGYFFFRFLLSQRAVLE